MGKTIRTIIVLLAAVMLLAGCDPKMSDQGGITIPTMPPTPDPASIDYVENPSSKEKELANTLIDVIRDLYEEHRDKLDWNEEETYNTFKKGETYKSDREYMGKTFEIVEIEALMIEEGNICQLLITGKFNLVKNDNKQTFPFKYRNDVNTDPHSDLFFQLEINGKSYDRDAVIHTL